MRVTKESLKEVEQMIRIAEELLDILCIKANMLSDDDLLKLYDPRLNLLQKLSQLKTLKASYPEKIRQLQGLRKNIDDGSLDTGSNESRVHMKKILAGIDRSSVLLYHRKEEHSILETIHSIIRTKQKGSGYPENLLAELRKQGPDLIARLERIDLSEDLHIRQEIARIMQIKGHRLSRYILQYRQDLTSFRRSLDQHIKNIQALTTDKKFLAKLSKLSELQKDKVSVLDTRRWFLQQIKERVNTWPNDPQAFMAEAQQEGIQKYVIELHNIISALSGEESIQGQKLTDSALLETLKASIWVRNLLLLDLEKQYFSNAEYSPDISRLKKILPAAILKKHKRFMKSQKGILAKIESARQNSRTPPGVEGNVEHQADWQDFIDFYKNIDREDHEIIDLFGDKTVADILARNKKLKGNTKAWEEVLQKVIMYLDDPKHQFKILQTARERILTATLERINKIEKGISSFEDRLGKTLDSHDDDLNKETRRDIEKLKAHVKARRKAIRTSLKDEVESIFDTAKKLWTSIFTDYVTKDKEIQHELEGSLGSDLDKLSEHAQKLGMNLDFRDRLARMQKAAHIGIQWTEHAGQFLSNIHSYVESIIDSKDEEAVYKIYDYFQHAGTNATKAIGERWKEAAEIGTATISQEGFLSDTYILEKKVVAKMLRLIRECRELGLPLHDLASYESQITTSFKQAFKAEYSSYQDRNQAISKELLLFRHYKASLAKSYDQLQVQLGRVQRAKTIPNKSEQLTTA